MKKHEQSKVEMERMKKQTNKGIVALRCIPSSSQFIWIMAGKLCQSEAGAREVGYLVQEIQIQQTWEGCVTQPWGKVASQYHWQQGLDPWPAEGFGLMRDLTTASGGNNELNKVVSVSQCGRQSEFVLTSEVLNISSCISFHLQLSLCYSERQIEVVDEKTKKEHYRKG